MKALISPLEVVSIGVRIAQVENTAFDVAEPLYWVDCPNDCDASTWFYNESTLNCEPIPIPVPTADDNKQTAISLLQQTDWTTIADVGNPQMANPYLSNQAEFIAWRSQVRAIAVNPVGGVLPIFDEMPQEVWKTV